MRMRRRRKTGRCLHLLHLLVIIFLMTISHTSPMKVSSLLRLPTLYTHDRFVLMAPRQMLSPYTLLLEEHRRSPMPTNYPFAPCLRPTMPWWLSAEPIRTMIRCIFAFCCVWVHFQAPAVSRRNSSVSCRAWESISSSIATAASITRMLANRAAQLILRVRMDLRLEDHKNREERRSAPFRILCMRHRYRTRKQGPGESLPVRSLKPNRERSRAVEGMSDRSRHLPATNSSQCRPLLATAMRLEVDQPHRRARQGHSRLRNLTRDDG